MLVIRREQMAVLAEACRDRFEREVVAHLQASFADGRDEHELRQLVRQGIARAAAHGFRAERDVCAYVDLMVILGSGFDRDLAWAAPVLQGPGSPADKIGRLFDLAALLAGGAS